MAKDEQDSEYSPKETKRRMDAALRRALNTPHKPNDAFVGKKMKAKRVARRPAKPKSRGAS